MKHKFICGMCGEEKESEMTEEEWKTQYEREFPGHRWEDRAPNPLCEECFQKEFPPGRQETN